MDEDLIADLEKRGEATVRDLLAMKVWNPRREMLVRRWLEKKQQERDEAGRQAIEQAFRDAPGGADRRAEREDWLRQLAEVGFDEAERLHAMSHPAANPMKWQWTQTWLATQRRLRKDAEEREREADRARDREIATEQKRHNKFTRRMALLALIASLASLVWQAYTYKHPVPPLMSQPLSVHRR